MCAIGSYGTVRDSERFLWKVKQTTKKFPHHLWQLLSIWIFSGCGNSEGFLNNNTFRGSILGQLCCYHYGFVPFLRRLQARSSFLPWNTIVLENALNRNNNVHDCIVSHPSLFFICLTLNCIFVSLNPEDVLVPLWASEHYSSPHPAEHTETLLLATVQARS